MSIEDLSFMQVQQSFMDHIKDPENTALPDGMSAKRMNVYNELFFNNIEGFIASGFPVLKSLYTHEAWLVLVKDFFQNHDCKTPYFLEIAQEFISFLAQEYQLKDYDPDFMLELAHYEWVELDVSIATRESQESLLPNESYLQQDLYISSVARLVSYEYPVQHISQDYMPTEKPAEVTCIIVYQELDFDVGFININQMTALMLQIISQEHGIQFDSVCEKVAQQVQHIDLNIIKQGAKEILSSLADKGILVSQN